MMHMGHCYRKLKSITCQWIFFPEPVAKEEKENPVSLIIVGCLCANATYLTITQEVISDQLARAS